MTRAIHPAAPVPVAPAAASSWATWPGAGPDVWRACASTPTPAALLEAVAVVQAQFLTTWFDQLAAVQRGWLELAKAVPAAMLVPLGWRLKVPVLAHASGPDVAAPWAAIAALCNVGPPSGEGPILPWLEAWKPAHAEGVVA
jgi:hypothetical protein